MREVGERNALNVIASSGSKEFEKDITKIIRGYRRVTEDWRSILRADYLMMLKRSYVLGMSTSWLELGMVRYG